MMVPEVVPRLPIQHQTGHRGRSCNFYPSLWRSAPASAADCLFRSRCEWYT